MRGGIKITWYLAVNSFCVPCALAGEVYVAPDGAPQGDGSRANPIDVRTAFTDRTRVRSGDTVLFLPGVYRAASYHFRPGGKEPQRRTVFKFAYRGNRQGRAVLTGPNNTCPTFTVEPHVRIEGLWIGGDTLNEKGAWGGVNRAGLEVIGCTFWVGDRPKNSECSFQLLCGNQARNMVFMDNLLVHMGGDWWHHPIYISGGPPPTTQDCRFIRNVFVNGGGFALHCWHKPMNISIVANFTSGHMASMVAQGPGHIIHHNVFWRPRGKPDRPDWNWNALLPNAVVRFDHNVLASNHPIREGGTPQLPPVQNYSLAGVKGTQVNLIPLPPSYLAGVPWVKQTPAQIESALQYVERYFSHRSAEQMAADRSPGLGKAVRILRVKYRPTKADLRSRPVE